MVLYLIEGMKKCILKLVNYEKVKEITQELGEGEIQSYSRVNGSRPSENFSILTLPLLRDHLFGQHFISQSTPDIRRKSQKLQYGLQTPVGQLLDMAFRVFNNLNQVKKDKRTQYDTRQAR